MGDHLARTRSYHEAIREVLLRDWDPIGVGEIPRAADEYDSYISEIHGLLVRQEPLQKLVDFLWWAETEHMELAGNRVHTERVAKRLLQLSNEMASSTEPGSAPDPAS